MTIYIVLYLLAFSGYLLNANKTKDTRRVYLIIIFGCILFVNMFRHFTVGTDLEHYYYKYYAQFRYVDWSRLQTVTVSGDWELGFCAFCKILANISTDIQLFIAVSSIVCIVPYAVFIYRNSEDVVFSTMFFIGYHILMMSMNTIRQGMAIGIILIGLETLKNKRYMLFLIYVIAASSFHYTALICIAFLFSDMLDFKKNTVYGLTLFTALLAVSYRYLFGLLASSSLLSSIYGIYSADSKGYFTYHTMGMFAIALMVFVVGYLYLDGVSERTMRREISRKRFRRHLVLTKDKLIVRKEEISEADCFSENLIMYSVYFAVLFRLCAFIINVTSRFSYYFLPFLMIGFPHALSKIKDEGTKRVYMGLMLIAVTVFFLFIGYTRAEKLWGTVPYLFCW